MTDELWIKAPSELVEKWQEEAGDRIGNTSKYGIQMIEAGRKEMGLADTYDQPTDATPEQDDQPSPGVPDLEHRIIQQLDEDKSQTPEEIVQGITENLEAEVEENLNELVRDNRAQFQSGGFVKR